MHFSFNHSLVVAALVSSIFLVLNFGERLFPLIALVASGIEAAIVFHLFSLSSGSLRIDVILPAVMLVAGAICWSRSDGKTNVTAGTIVTLVAAMQLLSALQVLQ